MAAMHGTLRIFRTPKFSTRDLSEFMKIALSSFQEFHFLLTDGIMLNFRGTFPDEVLPAIKVQRILTSYQLQKILMDSDENPYYISVASAVIDTWPASIIESIYDIMKIKSYYRGGIIFMNIVGKSGVFEKYFGNRVFERGNAGSRGGLYSWEEQFQQ